MELNKILASCAEFACLNSTKQNLKNLLPSGDLNEVRERLAVTAECDALLFRHGIGKVEYFTDVSETVARASKGSALSCAELLD
ncbi:MAG: hypothetical protein K2N47_05415, partial [Clostridia bacterium]|nr:hypothetical protein [Clostridia bacterium]